MMEYAVTWGEGTLLDYGVVELFSAEAGDLLQWTYEPSLTITLEPCADDCETGQFS